MSYAEKHNYEVAGVFQEEGESAKTADRPELQRMLSYCSAHMGEVDGVVVSCLDRFSRNMEDFVFLDKSLRDYGMRLFLTTREVDDTPEGKLAMNVEAAFAQYDNDKRSVRTTQGLIDGVKAGRWMWVAPVGYVNGWVNGKKNIVPDRSSPLRVALIQELWRLVDVGYTEAEALRIVNEKGLTQKNGCKVSKQTFSKMLCSKVYMGVIEAFGITVKSESIEPIIEETLWWRVYNRLKGAKVSPARHRTMNPEYPLRQFLTCARGHKLTGSASKGGTGTKYAYYHCVHCGKGGERYRVDKVHRSFSGYLDSFNFDEDMAEALHEAVRLNYLERSEAVEKTRKVLNKELIEVERSILTTTHKLISKVLTDEQAKGYLEACERRKQEAQSRLSELGSASSSIEQILNFGLSVLSNLGRTWENIKNIDVKRRFQRWIFPEGLSYDGEKFGTQRIACSLKVKQAKNAEGSSMVPPARFERTTPALGERCSVP